MNKSLIYKKNSENHSHSTQNIEELQVTAVAYRVESINNLSTQSVENTKKHREKSICKFCSFPRFTTVPMPEGHTHFAALRCGSCDGFHRWLESPHTQEEREKRRQRIGELLRSPLLSEWERGFLENVLKERKLSPKQLGIINRISGKVGGVA